MSFYEKSLNTLEMPRVLELLAAETVSEGAKEDCLKLRPYTEPGEVLRNLNETSAAKP